MVLNRVNEALTICLKGEKNYSTRFIIWQHSILKPRHKNSLQLFLLFQYLDGNPDFKIHLIDRNQSKPFLSFLISTLYVIAYPSNTQQKDILSFNNWNTYILLKKESLWQLRKEFSKEYTFVFTTETVFLNCNWTIITIIISMRDFWI